MSQREKGRQDRPRKSERRGGEMTVREAGQKGGEIRKGQLGPKGYAELGRKGGEAVARERGSEFFQQIGQKGGVARKEQLGPQGYSQLGRMGGEARKEQLGPHGYSQLGQKGGQRVKQLIEEGKRAAGLRAAKGAKAGAESAQALGGEVMGRDISEEELREVPRSDELAGATAGNVGGEGSPVLAGAKGQPRGDLGTAPSGAERDFKQEGPESIRARREEADSGERAREGGAEERESQSS